jgi:hypothetical protein
MTSFFESRRMNTMLASNMLTKDQMLEQYEVLGFAYGLCVVERKSDGVKGTLDFGDFATLDTDDSVNPLSRTRYYYNFVEA